MGINNGINASPPSQPVQDMEGPAARPAQPDVHEQAAKLPQPDTEGPSQPDLQKGAGDTLKDFGDEPARRDPVAPAAPSSTSQNHEDEKTALVVCGVAVGLLALWLLR